jgi:hypothetical protein
MNMNIVTLAKVLSSISGNTTVDTFLLLEDENFIEFYKSWENPQLKNMEYTYIKKYNDLMIEKLTEWVNNNY